MGRASNARGINMFQQGIMAWAMQKQQQEQALKVQEARAETERLKTDKELKLLELAGQIQTSKAGEQGSVGFASPGRLKEKFYKAVEPTPKFDLNTYLKNNNMFTAGGKLWKMGTDGKTAKPISDGKISKWVDKTDSSGNVTLFGFGSNGEQLFKEDLGRVGRSGDVSTPLPEKLTKPTVSTQQKSIINLSAQLSDANTISAAYKKEFLTLPGKVKNSVLVMGEKLGANLGPKQKKYVQGVRTFQEKIEQVFNAYRKEITGAQAAMKEIAMLRQSVLNKELSPSQFEASYKHFTDKLKRIIRLKRRFLRMGISDEAITGENGKVTSAVGDAIDALWFTGEDASADDKQAYGQELYDRYVDELGVDDVKAEDMVRKQLLLEGY